MALYLNTDCLFRVRSGGMKRRLSVAIALTGQPEVCYLDEPSTGLDPASRRLLWDAVLTAKQRSSVILTTHSMEEADALCERVAIMVEGRIRCIGAPKELSSRFGNFFVVQVTTPATDHQMQLVRQLLQQLSAGVRFVYAMNGSQKYELPKADTSLQQIFLAVRQAKREGLLHIMECAVSNATLEQAFLAVAAGHS